MFRNWFFLLCLAFNVLNLTNASAANSTSTNEAFRKTLKKVVPAINNAGTIDYKAGCSSCAQGANNAKNTTLYSKNNNQKIDLSVLSEVEANNTFSELAARQDIPYGYAMDGCYARAHKMVRILEDKGIIAGKAFLEGDLYVDTKFGEVGWGYNVAPVIMVKKDNTIAPYVFDPSLFSKPVPFDEWKAKITSKSKSKLTREYFTNRFAYDPEDRTKSLTDYVDENIDDMEITNRNTGRLLVMYNIALGQKQ
ncbi:MAG: protein-glutamine glutaminase family protein [Bacteriovorax sp.]|nr:protein-glutamine glutaminase family protein [Bacteriovorax sp.]